MKKYGIVAGACAGVALLIIGYVIFFEPKAPTLILRIGRPEPLARGSQYVASSTEVALGCGAVKKSTSLFTVFSAVSNGYVTVTTDATDIQADTVLRIKLNSSSSRQECKDDISTSDKRSTISRFWVEAKTSGGTPIKYRISIGIKTNTPDYDIKYTVVLSDK